jgi:hypothetical protein
VFHEQGRARWTQLLLEASSARRASRETTTRVWKTRVSKAERNLHSSASPRLVSGRKQTAGLS